ncbi:MAG TPA: alpha amylase C-terminal domain-containing protein, partial [Isosphaeraceae bacterium]|nr:alpha amylase C-terminal domain-containing protein [Isosphaeraceae bacterium]
TAFPKVSRPTRIGGLGFDLKWDLGWVHDTVDNYMSIDPLNRKDAHDKLTFRQMYAYSENYILAHSHDEVVYSKRSLLGKMPGDRWQQFANLRTLLGYMYTLPGKKLLFMGSDFAQEREWNHDQALDWPLLDDPMHSGLHRWVRDLNTTYRAIPALHELDCHPDGFQWVEVKDQDRSVFAYLRKARHSDDQVLVACNFTPVPRHNYRLGVPRSGPWQEILNGDARLYGGSGQGNLGSLLTSPVPSHGFDQSLNLVLPPLSVIAMRCRS